MMTHVSQHSYIVASYAMAWHHVIILAVIIVGMKLSSISHVAQAYTVCEGHDIFPYVLFLGTHNLSKETNKNQVSNLTEFDLETQCHSKAPPLCHLQR